MLYSSVDRQPTEIGGMAMSEEKKPKYKLLGKMEIITIVALIVCCLLLV